MGNYLDNYKNRLGNVDTIRDSHKQTAKSMVNDNFSNSPSYQTFTVDGVSTEGIVQSGKTFDMRVILLRPDTVISRGCYVDLGSSIWLVTDFNSNDVYPKIMLQRCNDQISWVDEFNVTHTYHVIMNSNATLYQFGFVPDKMMQVVNAEFHAFVKHDSNTSKIKENFRFVIGEKSFVTTSIDRITLTNDNVGISRLHLKADITRDADSTTIADNTRPIPGGGKLW